MNVFALTVALLASFVLGADQKLHAGRSGQPAGQTAKGTEAGDSALRREIVRKPDTPKGGTLCGIPVLYSSAFHGAGLLRTAALLDLASLLPVVAACYKVAHDKHQVFPLGSAGLLSIPLVLVAALMQGSLTRSFMGRIAILLKVLMGVLLPIWSALLQREGIEDGARLVVPLLAGRMVNEYMVLCTLAQTHRGAR